MSKQVKKHRITLQKSLQKSLQENIFKETPKIPKTTSQKPNLFERLSNRVPIPTHNNKSL